MKLIIFMLLSFAVQAESYNYLEISQGIKIDTVLWKESNWNGKYPTAVSIGHHWDYKDIYFRAQFNHLSNIDRGAPFNDKSETWLDQVNVTMGIKF